MKGKGILALLMCMAMSGSASASLFAYDGFDYPLGSLGGNFGGFGWIDAWSGINTVNSPGMTYQTLPVIGNRAVSDSSTVSFRTLINPQGTADTTIWISFIGQSGGSYSGAQWNGISLYRSSYETLFLGMPFQDVPEGDHKWGVDLKTVDGKRLSAIDVTEKVFFVVRIDYQDGNDTVTFWLNPALGTEPLDGDAVGQFTVSDHSFNRIRIAGGSGSLINYDELHIGQTYYDVVELPKPPKPIGATKAQCQDIPGFKIRSLRPHPAYTEIPSYDWMNELLDTGGHFFYGIFLPGVDEGRRADPVANIRDNCGGIFGYNRTYPGIDDPFIFPADGPSDANNDNDDYFATEITGVIHLTAGRHMIGVNSDDGAIIEIGGVEIGRTREYKSSSSVDFEFTIAEEGCYDLRVRSFENQGGACIELHEILADGKRVLLNDVSAGGSAVYLPSESSVLYLFVDGDSNGANNGSSWTDAYNYLQDALAYAETRSEPIEIRVAQGIYMPSRMTNPSDPRTATFQLINDVALRGGYAGFGEPDPNARDLAEYETLLSGDLAGDDVFVEDPCDLVSEPTRTENSYHVVTASRVSSWTVLDGFTIVGGHANGVDTDSSGSGLLNMASWPSLNNCIFRGNIATYSGGGMYNLNSGPMLTNCTFSENFAGSGGGVYDFNSTPTLIKCTFSGNSAEFNGSGMGNYLNSNPKLTNCTFSGNSAANFGGGIYNSQSSPTLINCTIRGNSAKSYGGGIYNGNSNPTLTNCTLTANSAGYDGGGMYNSVSSPILTNCTFSGNSADKYGGGIYDGNTSNPNLTNCILWGDWPDEIYGSSIISYSVIQGGYGGTGNIDSDPCFARTGYWADVNDPNIIVEPNNPIAVWIDGDYHLKSQAGRWDSNDKNWIYDEVTSPCIDTGDPCSDWKAELWPHGERINMGAYGGTPQASMSQSLLGNIADFDDNCFIDINDLAYLTRVWLERGPLEPDMDRNGFVNFLDFALFVTKLRCQRKISAADINYNLTSGASQLVEFDLFDPKLGCLNEVRLILSMDPVDFGAIFDNESVAASYGDFTVAATVSLQHHSSTLAEFQDSKAISATIGDDDEIFPIGVPDFEGTDTVVVSHTLPADYALKILNLDDFTGVGSVQLPFEYTVDASSSLSSVHSRIDPAYPATGRLIIEYIYCER